MKSVSLNKFVFIVIAMCITAATAAGEKKTAMQKKISRSLVIMLDGARSDALLAADVPFLKKLIRQQWHPDYKVYYSYHARAVTDAPTDSAPNHTAIATGVTASKNQVTANGLINKGNYKQYPSYLRRIAEKTGSKTLFCYLWNEDKFLDDHQLVSRLQCESDEKNYSEMIKILNAKNPPGSILWFIDAPDLGGHRSGFYPYGPLYLAALNKCDQFLEATFNTIARRQDFANEDWLIIITSDHGGIESTHGPRGSQLETLPFIVVGSNIPAGCGCGILSNFDCAALVLQHHKFEQLPPELDARKPDMQTLSGTSPVPVRHETFDLPGISGTSGAAESGFRLGFRNGALKIDSPDAKLTIPHRMQKISADGSFSCAFYLRPEKVFREGMIWQFDNLQLRYSGGKIFLQGKKNGQVVRCGEFSCQDQVWQLAVITADRSGNVALGWGAADGFFYFASAIMDLPSGSSPMQFGQGFTGRMDELLIFDRTVKMQDFSEYFHRLRMGGEYHWQ